LVLQNGFHGNNAVWQQVPSATAEAEAQEETAAHAHNDYPLKWKCQPRI